MDSKEQSGEIMPAIIVWLLGPIGRWLMIGLTVLAVVGGIYAKGRIDGKASYKAKLEREIKAAITKGDTAREEALKKFDANKEIEGDGYERD